MNVGLCWSSGIREGIWMTEYGKRKSMHFDVLLPILSTIEDLPLDQEIDFYSLQVGPERKQIDPLLPKGWIEDMLPEKPTWAETAALIE